MSNERNHILLEYGGVQDGTALSGQLCPSCRGGASGETSLSVGRSNGLLWWRCHRNKCSFRGVHGARASQQEMKAEHAPGRWNYSPQPLSKDWLEWLSDRFHIDQDLIDREWQWTDKYEGRVVMPIKNDRGLITGNSLRSYNPDNIPKSLIHRINGEVGQAWYRSSPYASVVMVVEDQPSALRASTIQGVDAIALLGTYVPESFIDRLRFVYRHKHRVLLALDQDATEEAVRAVVEWKSALPSLEVFPLDLDIKDHSPEHFKELIRRIRDE